MNAIHNKESKSPVLQAAIIVSILTIYINEFSFYALALEI
jgi:hypothetical protein